MRAHDHKKPTLFSRPDRLDSPLYVVTPVINAARYRTRWKLYEDFRKHVAEAGAILYTVEVAFGKRDFVVTSPNNPLDIQLRTFHELWLKENAIKVGVSRLPADWEYVAWIDADCHFVRPDWADEARHQLQHYPIIQMWSQLNDVNPYFEIYNQMRSFMDVQVYGPKAGDPDDIYYTAPIGGGKQKFGSPGLAWACRREAWNAIGGPIDYCILGAGDWYLAMALAGRLDEAIGHRNDLTDAFAGKMSTYADNLRRTQWEERPIVGNCGLMRGLVIHYWHGPRSARKYKSRGQILMDASFNPDTDLKVDWQGIYQLTSRNPQLRRDIQKYFSERNEDAL